MVINSETKIATLIKHHPGVLEAIITISPDFKKLRNPLLRRIMAGRTSIYMASKIGGCKPRDFFEKLKPFGFTADVSQTAEEQVTQKQPLPSFINALDPADVVTLNVCPLLAEGNDPLKVIQGKISSLKQGQALKIINSFEPSPLIKLLEKQGFTSYVDARGKDLVETYFYRTAPSIPIRNEARREPEHDWDELFARYETKLHGIDVRHLAMPLPMTTILETLAVLPDDSALYVLHKRIPLFLLTELKDRRFDFRIKEVKDGEVYLLIFKP